MKQKPRIRHCRNCQWHCSIEGYYECRVRYTDVLFERLRALFCRFYEVVEEDEEVADETDI